MWLASFFLPFLKMVILEFRFSGTDPWIFRSYFRMVIFLVALGIYKLHGIEKFSIKLMRMDVISLHILCQD